MAIQNLVKLLLVQRTMQMNRFWHSFPASLLFIDFKTVFGSHKMVKQIDSWPTYACAKIFNTLIVKINVRKVFKKELLQIHTFYWHHTFVYNYIFAVLLTRSLHNVTLNFKLYRIQLVCLTGTLLVQISLLHSYKIYLFQWVSQK